MELTARLYNCVRCHAQVRICSRCDRNNIYCISTCSRQSRVLSLRMAGKRYQNSLRGRQMHARRQQRYRAQKKIVTHHSSLPQPPNDLLPPKPNDRIKQPARGDICCQFCGKPCSPFIRRGYLHRSDQRALHISSGWPRAP
jgi:hypothetical protein